MPRWLISHPACGFSLCETYRREGKKSPHHPPCANKNHHSDRGAVCISSKLFASETCKQKCFAGATDAGFERAPRGRKLQRGMGEPFPPTGAGRRQQRWQQQAEGLGRSRRGRLSGTSRRGFWQGRQRVGVPAVRIAWGEALGSSGRGVGENLCTRLRAPRLRCNVLLYKYVQRDILHPPIRSIARCSKYPRASNSSGWGKIAKERGWKGGKTGKSERKGQRVAFPSTPSTASPAPCSVCRDPAPPGRQSFPQGCLMLLTAAAKPQGSIHSQSPC